MRIRALVVAVLLASVPVAARADPACTNVPRDRRMSNTGIRLTQTLGLASGKYALPRSPRPKQMVVLLHGYGNDSCSWRNHLRQVAQHGAVAIAMDYTGQNPKTNRGWRVEEGAEDSIKAAKHFLKRYPSIKEVFAFGISMGGNSSGLMVASPNAKRSNGKPLFDQWVAVEGVHDLIEEYTIARNLSAEFREDVEQEAGGTFEERPDRYQHLTNTMRADEMSYLRGAVLIHGVDDGLVPTNQSREMASGLRRVGVPTELYTVLGRGDGESGTTLSANAGTPLWDAAGLGAYEGPIAGHGWEGSDTQLVVKLGFEQLWKLMDGKQVATYRETFVHGDGLRVPAP
jgi:pimeloyl-ACP methyl ester carboxylesterase